MHYIVYPGQSVPETLTGEVAKYIPCNSRNYIVNDGNQYNANGAKVGDQGTLIKATTNSGTQITIATTALWTVNQSEQALRDFYTVLYKYSAFSGRDESGDANFATEGWNGMLSENFGPALGAAARRAAAEVDDTVWQTHNPEQYQILADKMSAYFADEVRARFGFSEDLFCGSGNSGWTDPNNPGTGEFVCMPVRVIVDDVEVLQVATDTGTDAQLDLNKDRLSSAQALYGDQASYWLGLQDTIASCKASGSTCVFNIGGINSIPITVPTAAPVVEPTATEGQ